MVALGTGAQKAVQAQIESLGTDLLSVYAGQQMHRGVSSSSIRLTTEDSEALEREGEGFKAIIPEMRRSQQVKYVNQNINVNVIGTSPEYVSANNYTVDYGRMFTLGDGESRKRVAVLGFAVPDQLSSNPAAMLGQQIFIRGIQFEGARGEGLAGELVESG
jgi:putative ABC transport system permease protein